MSSEPRPAAPAGDAFPLWRRNLGALWVAEFTAIFGFAFAFPFMPLYLRELGITDPHALPIWAGWATGVSGLALAAASPLWGALGDRFGRRPMLIRSMLGGALSVAALGFAQSPIQVLLLRAVQGASSGTMPAATAIAAAGTPRARVAMAMGILTSSVAVGSAVGPAVGGLVASAVGVRHLFQIAGALLLGAFVFVILVVKEPPFERRRKGAPPLLAVLRSSRPGTLPALAVLVLTQFLIQASYTAFQPLLSIRILEVAGVAHATGYTGLAFGLSGLAGALAAVLYPGPARRLGYVAVIAIAGFGLALAEVACAVTGAVTLIVVAGSLAGISYGVIGPATSAMIGLESPPAVQAAVFGIASSATALGFAFGPIIGGEVGSLASVPWGMAIAASFAVFLALVIAIKGKEPAR